MADSVDVSSLPPPPSWVPHVGGKAAAPSVAPQSAASSPDTSGLPPPPAWVPRLHAQASNVAPTAQPKPTRVAGGDWLQSAMQGAKGFAGGMNVPLWNAVGSIPIPAVQRFAQKESNIAGSIGSPTGQALGQGTTNALTMLTPAGPEAAGGAIGRMASLASQSGIASGLLAPQGQKTQATTSGAILGGALGAGGEALGGVLHHLAPGLEHGVSPEQADLVRRAQSQGYTVPPKSAGVGGFIDFVTKAFKSDLAKNNRALYDKQLLSAMGSSDKRLNQQSLENAGKNIVSEFDNAVKGVAVPVPEGVLTAAENLVRSKPLTATETTDDQSILNAMYKARDGGTLDAKDWQRVGSRLKAMVFKASDPTEKNALSTIANQWVQAGLDIPKVKAAYAPFNRQYSAYAAVRDATEGDINFRKGAPVNADKLFKATSQYANPTADPAQLNAALELQRNPYENRMSPALKYGSLGLGSTIGMTHLPYVAPLGAAGSAMLGGALIGAKSLQKFYESPAGQRALREGLRVDPATGNLVRAATRAGISQYQQGLPSTP